MTHDAPTPVPAAPAPPGGEGRGGFSMVEVIIAIMILAIGVLGLAGTTALVVRQITLGDLLTERAVALQTVVERLQATPFANVTDGSDSVGVFSVTWTTQAESSTSTLVTVITSGPGLSKDTGAYPVLGPSVADTFTFRVIN